MISVYSPCFVFCFFLCFSISLETASVIRMTLSLSTLFTHVYLHYLLYQMILKFWCWSWSWFFRWWRQEVNPSAASGEKHKRFNIRFFDHHEALLFFSNNWLSDEWLRVFLASLLPSLVRYTPFTCLFPGLHSFQVSFSPSMINLSLDYCVQLFFPLEAGDETSFSLSLSLSFIERRASFGKEELFLAFSLKTKSPTFSIIRWRGRWWRV